ncbi:P-loop containing nucleoside triphosphate hydrolase [Pseudocohnilembus persalinus]|uniref:p-loop containing nucleoside triphosphate hydrolase n=1 Tax=Pseudocohnilembus persalinus TaxID=266149 RepID=A0A0V0QYU6_PSEPJ|nr:P-loop containing nucleoside triphosphate hydrolase [Pseudocohnilembus persalinus]|eukprot:KRX07484.1 P-loop containing nucleoside triphosphate hydrolase [Pseudocohnilembus persalinus]
MSQKLQLIYNYENKENEQKKSLLFQESAQIIYEIQKQIPNGVIVFLQSYKDVQEMKEFIEKIYVKNRNFNIYLFFDGFGSGEQLLLEYGECIKKGKEAVLVSVMGGKLSEGINFKDEMARAILVFGLPFPNRNAPELREKMLFYDQQQNPEFKGKDYYFNGCLKVVNQTIGRCIRHINDYSLVFLIDKRFGDQQIIQGLPQWYE